ncbi:DUF2512 family protein [Paenibacillus alkalitolerans]|uniref:DUF2512 family protein n=1 Tax=Paenibacillus alkalitolerans TaxID=2799335 RepID=UPI0018F71502|nr:DUF2512 family protein [Paenibacillus alkalitolerans]
MAGLFVKLIVCPLTVILASYLFPNVNYTALYQPIIVGLVLAVAAHMMEVFLLKEGTFWLSTAMDFIAATLIVYFVSLFQAANVTFFGAILTAILLTLTEIVQHRWLIRSGRTQKAPQE